jgi:peptide/nickel transport system ATP-binding protein
MGSIGDGRRPRRLLQIGGAMPRLNAISGCAFQPALPRVFAGAAVKRPDLLPAGAARAACWLHDAQAKVAA